MQNAQNSTFEIDALEANTGELPPLDRQITRFYIVCLECGATGSLVSSKDNGSQEMVGFTDHAAENHENGRRFKCEGCGQSTYELVRDAA